MQVIQLLSSDNEIFETICRWNYNWWGVRDGKPYEAVRCNLLHSLCTGNRLPQTFVALVDGKPAGMYQFAIFDDLESRPDIYPWLINVYVDEAFRGRNVFRTMMQSVRQNAMKAGISELFLYTAHVGLYEKFGWQFVEYVQTFREESPIERLYRLTIADNG